MQGSSANTTNSPIDLTAISEVLPTAPFQVGALVPDLDEAIALHSAFGATDWVTSGWRTGEYYDRGHDAVISPSSRVAFGRLTNDLAIELIELDATGPRPVVWDMEAAPATAHIGYWVEDTQPIAAELIAAGGTLLLAKATVPALQSLPEEARARDWVPEELDACYVRKTRLPAGFGSRVAQAIPAPPSR
jgi:hypothetical protein